MLLDNQRWQVKRGRYPYSRVRLIPIREYGDQPENGDELVPAPALDKAIAAMKQAMGGTTRREADAALAAALRDLAR